MIVVWYTCMQAVMCNVHAYWPRICIKQYHVIYFDSHFAMISYDSVYSVPTSTKFWLIWWLHCRFDIFYILIQNMGCGISTKPAYRIKINKMSLGMASFFFLVTQDYHPLPVWRRLDTLYNWVLVGSWFHDCFCHRILS